MWRSVDRDPAAAVRYLELAGDLMSANKQRATAVSY